MHTYEEGKDGGQDFMNMYSLNEYQLEKSKWRKTLDSDRATVFATELMENACKVAKWTIQVCVTCALRLFIEYVGWSEVHKA